STARATPGPAPGCRGACPAAGPNSPPSGSPGARKPPRLQAGEPGGPRARLNSLHDDFSKTPRLVIRWVTRQTASALGQLDRRGKQNRVGVGQRTLQPSNFEAVEAANARLDRRRAAALEQVEAHVVVIAIPAQEAHDVPRLRHRLHAEGLVE